MKRNEIAKRMTCAVTGHRPKKLPWKRDESILIVEAAMMNYGYIRVSAKDQNGARQLAAMEKLDILPDISTWINRAGKTSGVRPIVVCSDVCGAGMCCTY